MITRKKFVHISDLHIGYNGNVKFDKDLPPGDVLLITGDVVASGTLAQWTYYWAFIRKVAPRYEKIFFVPGNHDYNYLQYKQAPDNYEDVIDKIILWNGFLIAGFTKQDRDEDGAYYTGKEDMVRGIDALTVGINKVQILMTHYPAHYVLDKSLIQHNGSYHGGIKEYHGLLTKLCPDVHVHGHIHSAYGTFKHGRINTFNGSQLNDHHRRVHRPHVFFLQGSIDD